jgi:hypothetical protein
MRIADAIADRAEAFRTRFWHMAMLVSGEEYDFTLPRVWWILL